MGIPFGVGQGLNEGVKTAASFLLPAMQMKQRQAQFDKAMDADLEWKRGLAGLGPSFEDQASSDSQSPMPAIPSSASMDQPTQVGRMAVPGQALAIPAPVQPMAPAPRPQAEGNNLTPAQLLMLSRPSMALGMSRPRRGYQGY